MTITFWTLSKRKNSTKQPAITGTDYTGTLTTESGMVSPSVIMDFGQTAPTYNYAYITEFGRYYWINEITSIGGGLWRVEMSCDVLASFKTSIGSASKYILRCASESDGDVVDIKYPTKAGYTRNELSVSSGWLNDLMTGSYIVGIVDDGGSFGSLSIYNLTNAEFASLRQAIAPSLYYNGITDTDLKNLAISIVNPMQYIAWVRYYPFTIPQGSAATITLGNITVSGHKISTTYFQKSYSFTFTNHPLAATRGDYLSNEPFTSRFLTWQPVGMIHIPGLASKLTGITVFTIIDLISGVGDLEIRTTGSIDVYRTSFTAGIDIPVAQVVSGNPLKIISGSIGLISGGFQAMAGNTVGAVGSGASAITDFLTANVGEVQAFKPGAGALISDPYVRVDEYFANVVDDDNLEFGRPLCKVRSISLLSGFIQCADGEIYAVGATAGELDEIAGYLTGGFYYE